MTDNREFEDTKKEIKGENKRRNKEKMLKLILMEIILMLIKKTMEIQLTEEQREGLNNYVNTTPPLINIILWGDDVSDVLLQSLQPEQVDSCLDLLTIFDMVSVSTTQTIVYRGISTVSIPLVSSGLMSTSPQTGEAAKYVGTEYGHLIRIIVPAGCHVVWPGDYNVFNPYDEGDEAILLLGTLTPIQYHDQEYDNEYDNGFRSLPITTYLYGELPNAVSLATDKLVMFQKSQFPNYTRQIINDDDDEQGGFYDEQGNYHTEEERQEIIRHNASLYYNKYSY